MVRPRCDGVHGPACGGAAAGGDGGEGGAGGLPPASQHCQPVVHSTASLPHGALPASHATHCQPAIRVFCQPRGQITAWRLCGVVGVGGGVRDDAAGEDGGASGEAVVCCMGGAPAVIVYERVAVLCSELCGSSDLVREGDGELYGSAAVNCCGFDCAVGTRRSGKRA